MSSPGTVFLCCIIKYENIFNIFLVTSGFI